jgi:glycosyltransferase involved in cell wall biosynthesis
MNSPNNYPMPTVAVVIPAYRVEREIEKVVSSIPANVQHIIVVDDASPDHTGEVLDALRKKEPRLVLLRHERNQGVGGAMVSGFRKALELGAQIIVKMDGDGQMDPAYLHNLIAPLVQDTADYTKGNRFRDFVTLRQMPIVRRFGNIVLGFITKVATGYWNIFDPTNGYVAIRSDVLAQLPLERVARTYYFETSMLAELYLIGAFVQDVPMPARYGDQSSSLAIHRILLEFPVRLLVTFLRRLALKYFLYDFSLVSVYLLGGIPLFFFGLIFGAVKWIKYASLNNPAPTGTVILPTLCVILGIQFLLSAIQTDLQAMPRVPLSSPYPKSNL